MANPFNLDFLSLRTEAFGLDLSDLSLKVIKLKKKRDFFSLASFGEEEIPSGVIAEGKIKNEDSLAKTIKKAFLEAKGEKIRTKYAVISLPEEEAFLQVIQVPKMSEEELKKAVRFEAENYIPLPLNEAYFDFQVVPPFVDHLDHLDILVAALPKKAVDPYVSAIKKAGLIPLILEIESLAIARAVVKNGVSPFPILLIDLGATRTSFIIFAGFSLRFTSSIPVSSIKFTEAIAKNLNIGLEEAEKLKVEYGLAEREQKEGKEVFEALIPALTDLMEQLKTHLRYYQTHSLHEHLANGRGVEKIILCGGGANLKGLDSFISRELKLPVEIGNPWINILGERPKEVPRLPYQESMGYTTALGLALRGVENSNTNHTKL